MNKTINTNLGGMLFYIDENAYIKLNNYFDAIRRSLKNTSSTDEILKDIELRIAELLTENRKNDNTIVSLNEIEQIISVMGQPEDYYIENESQENETQSKHFNYTKNHSKKLYRDKENGTIGGVATGLAHYFGVEAVWLKVMFLIFVFAGFGTGIIAYIILWIATPEAVTTSEKLEMTGEPVTISNIEKKIREEFESVSDKIKNTDYSDLSNKAKKNGDKIGEVLLKIIMGFIKILGVFIVIFASIMLITLMTFFVVSLINSEYQEYVSLINYTQIPSFIINIALFLAIGIPFLNFILFGLRLIKNKSRNINKATKYSLNALWIISVVFLIAFGINKNVEQFVDTKFEMSTPLNTTLTDTIKVKFINNDSYSKNIKENTNFKIVKNSKNESLLYSNNVELHILQTDRKKPYFKVAQKATGNTIDNAIKFEENIKYSYSISENEIILDNYYTFPTKDKYRKQKVILYLYVPEKSILKLDSSIANYLKNSTENYWNLMASYSNCVFKMKNDKLNCFSGDDKINVSGKEIFNTDKKDEDEDEDVDIDETDKWDNL